MPVEPDPLSDPRFAGLSVDGLVELCGSLADYGEAGGLSRDLMLQVGSFAEARFGDELEVLLAVGRMYLLGGETARARELLLQAARGWPQENRVRPLLAHCLRLLDDPRTVDELLGGLPATSAWSGVVRTRPSAPPPEPKPARPASLPELPVVKAPAAVLAAPHAPPAASSRLRIAESAPESLARADSGRKIASTVPRMAAVRPVDGPLAPTPASGMPIVPRAPALPRGMEVSASARAPRPGAGSAKIGRTATVRVQVEEPVARPQAAPPSPKGHSARVTTEVNRRPVPREAPTPHSGEARSLRGGVSRNTRIRLLDPEDDGRFLDPYELIGELASGGMATVYLGRLGGVGGFQRLVAIKRLHPHLAREEQFVQMFLDEARIAAAIHHPHVVPILEIGMSDLGHYVVMEFIEGDTLGGILIRALQRGAVPPPSIAVRVVLDALAGLHASHQLTDVDGNYLGLVHRDCTPQNILVGLDGSARITDFGVARAASRLTLTGPQQVKGKVAYLSPEQAHALELDRRSDLFTMGIVLWEALAGRPLFQADTEAATLARLLSGQIPALQAFAPDLPPSFDEVCRRALASNRERRYRTAAEMAEALERAATADDGTGVASPRELGRFVESLMGAEIAAQREAVRAWLSQTAEPAPASRGPRTSGRSQTIRPPSTPRTSHRPPAASSPSFGADEAPETPAPQGEKVPRLSSMPPAPQPAPAQRTPTEPPRREADGAPAGSDAAPARPSPEPARPAVPAGAASPGPEAPPEPVAEASPAEAPSPPTAEPAAPRAPSVRPAPPAPRVALATRIRGLLPASVRRLLDLQVSSRQGLILVVAIVALALAPLGYRAYKQRALRGKAAAAARAPGAHPSAAPRPSPRPQPPPPPSGAWDEWPTEPSAAPSATPTAEPAPEP